MLEFHHMFHSYNDNPSVSDVSFSVSEGEVVTLLGPSGCGKTTLLRLAAGLERPREGEIWLDGKLVSDAGMVVAPETRGIGFMFQDYALFPNKTVRQNIAFGKGAGDHRERVEQLIAMAGIRGLEQRFPHEISGGQQQRVALVRALATQPTLLLLDEPLSHLDPELKESVRNELQKLFRETNTTALFVSHDIEDAMAMADRMVVMRDGKAEQIGTTDEVYDQPANRHVARLFGKTNFIPAGLLAEAENSFEGENGEGRVVQVWPHQWRIVEQTDGDSPVFTGKIKSVTNRGAHREVTLETEQLTLTIHLTGNVALKAGDSLSVSGDLSA